MNNVNLTPTTENDRGTYGVQPTRRSIQAVILQFDDAARSKYVPVLPGQRLIVGRGCEADCGIESDQALSRLHFSVVMNGAVATLRDLESRNGTEVNGQCAREKHLHNGDTIKAGTTLFAVYLLSS